MSDSSLPFPKYTMEQAVNAAFSLAFRALDEIRAIANRPPPRDGFGFDDMSFEHDGERTFTLRFTKGDEVKEFKAKIPVMLDRGVFKDDRIYDKGDCVTWAGSIWISQVEENNMHPRDGGSGAWRLAVKAGRDGRKM